MSLLGNRVVRIEDPALLTGAGRFVADISAPEEPLLLGAVHATFVRSTMAHARIVSVDISEVAGLPGVVGVFTAEHIAFDLPPEPLPLGHASMTRPYLAAHEVRYVGEPIAVVLTEQPWQGADAAEAVWVELEPLPALIGAETSAGDDAFLLYPASDSNVVTRYGETASADLFNGCEVVVRQRVENQRMAACPIEPRVSACAWSAAGDHITLWIATQSAHAVRDKLAGAYGLDANQVRVIAPDVGGGFGAKMSAYPEDLLLPWLARQVDRPVRWLETRSENMVGMAHGRAQTNTVEIGGTREGKIEAYRLTVLQDCGAYPGTGAFLPYLTRMMTQGCYDIARVECVTRAVVTTTTPVDAFRGAGRPEAAAAIERAVDLFAAEIGMDPAEVRRRNLIPADAFPFTTGVGPVYDCGDYPEALRRVLAEAGYTELRAEQERRRAANDEVQLGLGLAVYVEVTAGPGKRESEFAQVDLEPDGSATVYTGSSSHGQGHATTWAMLTSEQTGIPMARIRVVHGDTDRVAEGKGTFASRSVQLGASAVNGANERLIEAAKAVAADLLEAAIGDVVLDPTTPGGAFHVVGTPARSISWAHVAEAADTASSPLSIAHTFVTDRPTFPFGAHLAEVEVDTSTGRVRLRRFTAVDDAGRILNPLLADGQRLGGIGSGVAQALTEEFLYDNDGNPLTSNFADYGIVSAAELAPVTLVRMETPTPMNPLGAKGIGESGSIGSTPAVQNAVVDAVAHLGVRHIDIPCTAERVWRAIVAAAS